MGYTYTYRDQCTSKHIYSHIHWHKNAHTYTARRQYNGSNMPHVVVTRSYHNFNYYFFKYFFLLKTLTYIFHRARSRAPGTCTLKHTYIHIHRCILEKPHASTILRKCTHKCDALIYVYTWTFRCGVFVSCGLVAHIVHEYVQYRGRVVCIAMVVSI